MSDLYCNNCINSRLAELKRQRDQQEREHQLKYEQEALQHSQRLASLESASIELYRQQARQETEAYSKELEKKFQEKRKPPQSDPIPQFTSNFSQLEEARRKYRDELLSQINEKQSRAQKEKLTEMEIEKKRHEEIEIQKQFMLAELVKENSIQRENYKFALMQQANLKMAKKREEEYEKQVEKMKLDEQVRKYSEEQRKFVMMMKKGVSCDDECEGGSSCSGCHRVFPGQSLTKFP